MPEQVKVEDLEVFRHFRAAMVKFAQATGQSLANADGQIARTHSWLENEQATYWQSQLRKRTEAVTKARDAVRQKKLYKDFAGRTHDASQEEKFLARCLAAVEEAQNKIEAVRKGLPRLEKESELYRSGVSRLNESLAVDIPKVLALLDRLAASLEQYIQIESPAGGMAESVVPPSFGPTMSRGGEGSEPGSQPPAAEGDGAPPAPVVGHAAAASTGESEPPNPSRKEARDVAGGQ